MGAPTRHRIVSCVTAAIAAFCQPARCDSITVTQSVSAELAPAAKLSVPASVPLTASGAAFQPFSGTLTLSFRVRSSSAGGGAITLQTTSDFSPSGGPSAAGGALTYLCSNGTLGTPCTGRQTAGTGAQSSVLTIPPAACTGGGGACSASNPNSIQVYFSLENDSGTATGNYAAQITFVISAI
jgi:hypothetical protein